MVQRVRRLQNEREGGFTLIELLIVIVVLGILAGIVVLGLGTFRDDANTAACKADTKQVQIASDAFMARPTNPTRHPPAPLTWRSPTAAALACSSRRRQPPARSCGRRAGRS